MPTRAVQESTDNENMTRRGRMRSVLAAGGVAIPGIPQLYVSVEDDPIVVLTVQNQGRKVIRLIAISYRGKQLKLITNLLKIPTLELPATRRKKPRLAHGPVYRRHLAAMF